ncbi:MAG TPA: EAL domain-containing protein, partial [Acidimicrobiales bacterium]|nr:EAL domain-containing protein [Acidimicrobiales bacterium]
KVLGQRRSGQLFLYAWSLVDIGVIGVVVASTGGSASWFWVLFLLTTIFFAVGYPFGGQAFLLAASFATYVLACEAAGGTPSAPLLAWRMIVVAAGCALASFPAWELGRETAEHQRARQEADHLIGAMQTQEAWWRALVDRTSDPIVVFDEERRVRFASPAFEELLGYRLEPSTALDASVIVHPDDVDRLREAAARAAEGAATANATTRLARSDGEWRVFEVSLTALEDTGRGGLIANLHDVTERVAAAAALTRQARHDDLTDLSNRVAFYEKLQTCLSIATRTGAPLSVLVLDLQGFKDVNDTLGHAVGDELLIEIARRLTQTLRAADVVARLGGDEFAAVLSTGGDPEGATSAARRVLAAINEPMVLAGRPHWLRASIGLSCSTLHGLDPDQLVQRADRAMYEAKRTGIGVALFEDEMDTGAGALPGLLGHLRHAIVADELFLCFQPKVSLATGAIVGAEALVRWQHPRLGLLPPATFLPVAEASGLVRDITAWVLPAALGELKRWHERGWDLSVAVNLSAHDLADESFVSRVLLWLGRARIEPTALVLELTEASAIADRDQGTASLSELRSHGVRVSLDDFGSGYSSLAYLSELPLDEVKLDRGFTSTLGTDSFVLRSVVSIGHHLGLSVVAEGVETPEAVQLLGRLGVDVAQGYVYSEPVPGDAFVDLVERWTYQAPARRRRGIRDALAT